MAEQAGLEPATDGIKIRCTTFVLLLNCFGGGVEPTISEQIYSLPQHVAALPKLLVSDARLELATPKASAIPD